MEAGRKKKQQRMSVHSLGARGTCASVLSACPKQWVHPLHIPPPVNGQRRTR
jgi:hypothetical protein